MFLFSVVATSANVQFSSIASGAGYSCAVSAGFGVRCWGYGGFGTLGYGDMTSLQSIPSVELLKDAGSLAAGADFACSLAGIPAVEAYVPLNASLSLFCWGSNVHGQLGTGTDVANCVPVNVACAPSPVFVADGIPLHSRVVSGPASQHACLLSADGGELRCWGSGVRGQLGRGDTADFRSIPTDYVLSGVVSVATGWGHTCVIMKTTNGVRCWGHNGYGELGNGDVSGSVLVAPPAADVLVNVSTVSCGAHFTCVRMQASSGVRCWGGGYHGQLGNGRLDNLYAPPDADVITGVAFLAAGTDHVCVILQATSGVRCWGGNDYGELGNGRSDGLWSPVPPIADVLVGVRFLAAGSGVTCVIMSASNGVRCWGSNDHGALGNGGNSDAFCKLGVPCYTVPPPNDNPVLDHAGSVHGATAVGSHTRTAAIVAAVGGTCIVLLGIIWYRRCRGGERDVAPCPSVAANVSGGGHSHGSTGCVAHKAEFNGVAPQASHDIVESVALDRAARPAVSALRLPSHQPGEHEHKGSEYDFAMRRRAADGGSSPHHPADVRWGAALDLSLTRTTVCLVMLNLRILLSRLRALPKMKRCTCT
jgi:alpha-tubulin suppressor-like RCC1 family protein